MSLQDGEDLPTSWVKARLTDFAVVNPPGSTVTAQDGQLVTFLPMAAVEELTGKIDLGQEKPFGQVKKNFTRFRDGDVLFAKITPSMENGKVAVARGLRGGIGCGTTEFHVIRPHKGVHPDYIRYFIVRRAFREEAKRNMQGAVGQQRVPVEFLRSAELPLGPSDEQLRVVTKINELFSRISEGERALEQVQKLVERYRQSVLKAAVTGELTREWREKNKGKLESGDALLARILKARREAWEQVELEKMHAKGVNPKKEDWKKTYKEAMPFNIEVIDSVPDGWAQISLEQATRADRPIAYGVLQPGPDVPNGIPLVRVCDVADGKVEITNLKTVAPKVVKAFPRTKLSGGEVLLTLVGTIGRTAVVPNELANANVARAVGVLVPNAGISARWLEIFLRHEKTRQVLVGSSREVARKTLNLAQLREFAMPLPSEAEQAEIVSRLDELLSKASAVEQTLFEQARSSGALRQATLRSAFSGDLVWQDPSDEPASVLLERIAAEREKTVTTRPKRRPRKKAAARAKASGGRK